MPLYTTLPPPPATTHSPSHFCDGCCGREEGSTRSLVVETAAAATVLEVPAEDDVVEGEEEVEVVATETARLMSSLLCARPLRKARLELLSLGIMTLSDTGGSAKLTRRPLLVAERHTDKKTITYIYFRDGPKGRSIATLRLSRLIRLEKKWTILHGLQGTGRLRLSLP